jgi:4-amino-4-deoxy-L-arabinose transferase-like glycosyltransferase
MYLSSLDISREYAHMALIGIMLLGMFLMVFGLGTNPLRDYDEATYASITREGLERNNITLLTLRGEPNFTKPPLYFALAHASAKLFGMTEFAFRLPSALFGLGTVFLTYFAGLVVVRNRLVALLGAMALLCNGAFVEASRQVRLDSGVAFFAMAAFCCFCIGMRRRSFLVGVGISAGLLFLTKSLAILVIPPALLIGSIYYKNFRWLIDPLLWLGVAGGIAVMLPWLFAMNHGYGVQFWEVFLIDQGFTRIGTPIIGDGVTTWTYLRHLLRFTEPWFLLFLGALVYNAKAILFSPQRYWNEHKDAALFGGITLFIFTLFSISKTKLFYYLVPLYPFLALCLSVLFVCVLKTERDMFTRQATVCGVALLFLVGLGGSMYFGFHIDDSLGVMNLAKEERAIGEIAKEYSEEIPIYAQEHLSWETIEYYSHGKKVLGLPDAANRPKAYALVLPSFRTQAVGTITDASAKLLYQGPYLSLFDVTASR